MSDYPESYSIWLMPRGILGQKLQSEILFLATQHHAPVFNPHVTLLGDIKKPKDEVIKIAEDLAKELKPYNISFLDVAFGSIFFQCVYLLCAKDHAVMAAAARAREAYGMTGGQYMPHLSLLYADIPQSSREAVAASEVARLYGEGAGYETLLVETSFPVESLSIWYTPTEDKTLESWVQVADIPLSG